MTAAQSDLPRTTAPPAHHGRLLSVAVGLLRDFHPKGTDLSIYTPDDLLRVTHEPNDRPRKSLGWRTPHEVFTSRLTKAV